ncbi:hypothetical protein BMT54_04065 [Pasteurellaceae bacterium 15-036681]|nr:hypothetical protein BMT54_04065 [Pasteurellaceae bacterium 15-036681]
MGGVSLLGGCVTPIEQVQSSLHPVDGVDKNVVKAVEKRKVVKNQARNFVCKDNKVVRIVQTATVKKNKVITLTFNGTSHKLSSTVTKLGAKYSNIRWIWTEDLQGLGTLSDNRNRVLAEKCYQK